MDPRTRAQTLLEAAVGPGATFRDDQLDAILALAVDRRRLLVVERTGWGKSVPLLHRHPPPARRRRRAHRHRQSAAGAHARPAACRTRHRLEAETITSQQDLDEWRRIDERLGADEVDLLLLGPERLANEHFLSQTLPSIAKGIGMLVVDEAHCISDWGHDFRPDYRRIQRIVAQLPGNVPMLATTATANDRVVADVEQQLGPDLLTIRGSLSRTSLRLQNVRLGDQAERLAWLAENLERLPGSGIVYTLTKADAKRVSRWLATRGIDAPDYHADRTSEDRRDLEARLRRNDLKALVATIALGMGFDKPDLGFVVHFQRPGSVVAYYQQIGRAGRQLDSADIVLLAGREDDEIADYFIGGAFPPPEGPRSRGRRRQGRREVLADREHVARRRAARRRRHCPAEPRSRADARVRWHRRLPHAVPRARARRPRRRAVRALRRLRRRLPAPDRRSRSGARVDDFPVPRLPADSPPCPLAVGLEDPEGPHPAGRPPARGARAFGLRGRGLGPARQGGQVSSRGLRRGASRRDGGHDPDQLAARSRPRVGGLHPVVARPRERPAVRCSPGRGARAALQRGARKVKQTGAQKSMQNNAQQVANVVDAFQAVDGAVRPGPVLLFDDIVNSRWSLTVCGVLLREAGSGPVMPVVLATTSDD